MDKDKKKIVNRANLVWFVFLAYVVFVLIYYFAAGEQLFIRESKNKITSGLNDMATGEMVNGAVVEQVFQVKMDEVKSIDLKIATFARANVGELIVRVCDVQTGVQYFEQNLDISTIPDSQFMTLKFDKPIQNVRDHFLRIEFSSPTGAPGNAVALWYSSTSDVEGGQLIFNGIPTAGTLCFNALGSDRVWLGPNFWKVMGFGGLLIIIYCLNVVYNSKKCKKSLFMLIIVVLEKYKFLGEQLVARDFKAKYKRSALGVLWSFFNPLLTMTVQYIIFSTIFKLNIKNYPVYLLTGVVLFNFFSEAAGMSLSSIVGNASLITKVYVPRYIYPVTRVLSSSINLLISLLPLLVMILFTKTPITKAYFMLFVPLGCLIVFCIGLALLLSASMVFFRDTQFLWGVLSMLWMYATPIFYPESILPPEFALVHKINPMYHIISFARKIIIDGIVPEPRMILYCVTFAFGFLFIGLAVFKKTQDKFIFYI